MVRFLDPEIIEKVDKSYIQDIGDQENIDKSGFSVKVLEWIWLRRLQILGAKG